MTGLGLTCVPGGGAAGNEAAVAVSRKLDTVSRFLYTGPMAKAPVLKQQTYNIGAAEYRQEVEDLHDLALSLASIEQQIAATVTKCRTEGVTWAEIGRALGVTRSAAQQRFGR